MAAEQNVRVLKILPVSAVLAAACFVAGCGGPKTASEPAAVPVPDVYQAKFETSKGDFVVEVTKAWAPEGAERFHLLVQRKFYDGARFFRVLPRFVVQWGINGNPAVEGRWRDARIPDDPVKESNKRGYVSFATSGPNTRTTQVFVNMADNERLDARGFAPFGRVVSGMEVFDRLYSSYGDGPPRGQGPDQNKMESEGDAYIERSFPRLDSIRRASILKPDQQVQAGGAK